MIRMVSPGPGSTASTASSAVDAASGIAVAASHATPPGLRARIRPCAPGDELRPGPAVERRRARHEPQDLVPDGDIGPVRSDRHDHTGQVAPDHGRQLMRHHPHETAARLVDVEAVHAGGTDAHQGTIGGDLGIGKVGQGGRHVGGGQGKGFHGSSFGAGQSGWAGGCVCNDTAFRIVRPPPIAPGDTPGCQRSTTLADHERTFIVMAAADVAFDLLSDPLHLPDYVPTVRLEDSVAIEGEADADADLAERDGAPEAGFVADRTTRMITWGRPDHDYGGSITVRESTASTADITVRLHTRDAADAEAVARVFEQAVGSIRRLVMRRA
jgi:hypothetical protein